MWVCGSLSHTHPHIHAHSLSFTRSHSHSLTHSLAHSLTISSAHSSSLLLTGKGIGRTFIGRARAIRPKLKFDKSGIGGEDKEKFTFAWWDHAFNRAAQNIQVETADEGVSAHSFGLGKGRLDLLVLCLCASVTISLFFCCFACPNLDDCLLLLVSCDFTRSRLPARRIWASSPPQSPARS